MNIAVKKKMSYKCGEAQSRMLMKVSAPQKHVGGPNVQIRPAVRIHFSPPVGQTERAQ